MMQFIGLALGIVVVIGALTACTGVFTAVPEPPYKILAQQDAIEERETISYLREANKNNNTIRFDQ